MFRKNFRFITVYLIVQKRHFKTVSTLKSPSLLWHFCNHCHFFLRILPLTSCQGKTARGTTFIYSCLKYAYPVLSRLSSVFLMTKFSYLQSKCILEINGATDIFDLMPYTSSFEYKILLPIRK